MTVTADAASTDAASTGDLLVVDDLRTHFHVPIFTQGMNGWSSTRSEIERCLASFPGAGPLPTIEVETYAWDVLPNCLYAGDEGLASGIAEELRWLRAMIRSLDAGTAR